MTEDTTKTDKIQELNDLFRNTFIGGRVVITAGIQALPDDDQEEIITKVRTYDDFTEDNDPYGEHDFGAFNQAGQKIFWKVDYYNRDMSAGSEDPADLKQTTRVLTILLAEEW